MYIMGGRCRFWARRINRRRGVGCILGGKDGFLERHIIVVERVSALCKGGVDSRSVADRSGKGGIIWEGGVSSERVADISLTGGIFWEGEVHSGRVANIYLKGGWILRGSYIVVENGVNFGGGGGGRF